MSIIIQNPGGGKDLHIAEDPTIFNKVAYDGKYCGRCNLCCKHSVVTLYPEVDDIDKHPYKLKVSDDPEVWILPQQENGDCVYLHHGSCIIHDDRPALCKAFDCRISFLEGSDNFSKDIIRQGKLKQRKHPVNIKEWINNG